MKTLQYILFLTLSTILFVQCNKNESKDNDLGYSGEIISIDEIINFIPNYLLNPSTLIYKNASGDKMILKSISYTEVVKGKISNIEYSSESIETRLYSESNALLNITLIGSGMPYTDGSIVKSLTIMLMPMYPGGNLYLGISFNNGEPANDLITPNEISSLELLGRSFDSVFKKKKEDSDTYSEIYFSPNDGIIAFRDEYNDLWVLDEVIE